jgi:hypothetical protein
MVVAVGTTMEGEIGRGPDGLEPRTDLEGRDEC